MTDEEWGPWIEHDGKGCPCVGMFVESEDFAGRRMTHIAEGILTVNGRYFRQAAKSGELESAWRWVLPQHDRVARYRIRKPRALQQLREIAENVKEGVEA